MKKFVIISLLLIATSSHAKDPSDETLAILRQSSRDPLEAYKVYAEKYAHKTTGDAEKQDREKQWVAFSRYAKALWEAYDCIEVGDSIFRFPGLLSHGAIRWNDKKKHYSLAIGFRPFDPGDGLGTAGITFDMNGKIVTKNKAKYPW